MIPDYYSVLGVPENATDDAIRTAYLRLVRRYHPDVNKTAGAEERIREINLAYESLCDPIRRKHYDRAIQVLREERARIAYEERLRTTPRPPTPPSSPAPAPPAASPPQPPSYSAPGRPRPAGMRSGKVVLATVLLVALAMLVATRFDVPAKGEATFVSSDQAPHLLPTSTATVLLPSLILPDVAPTVAPLTQSYDSQPTPSINLATYMADLQATTTALIHPTSTRITAGNLQTIAAGLVYQTPTP